jgi:hypothetical protein
MDTIVGSVRGGEAEPTRGSGVHKADRVRCSRSGKHPPTTFRKSNAAWRQTPRRLFGLPTCRPPRSLARRTGLPFLRPADQGCT